MRHECVWRCCGITGYHQLRWTCAQLSSTRPTEGCWNLIHPHGVCFCRFDWKHTLVARWRSHCRPPAMLRLFILAQMSRYLVGSSSSLCLPSLDISCILHILLHLCNLNRLQVPSVTRTLAKRNPEKKFHFQVS